MSSDFQTILDSISSIDSTIMNIRRYNTENMYLVHFGTIIHDKI